MTIYLLFITDKHRNRSGVNGSLNMLKIFRLSTYNNDNDFHTDGITVKTEKLQYFRVILRKEKTT